MRRSSGIVVQQILMVRSFVPPYTTTAHEKVKLAVRCLFGNPSVSAAAHKKGSKKHILGALKKNHFTAFYHLPDQNYNSRYSMIYYMHSVCPKILF